jgi:hypothetical protein
MKIEIVMLRANNNLINLRKAIRRAGYLGFSILIRPQSSSARSHIGNVVYARVSSTSDSKLTPLSAMDAWTTSCMRMHTRLGVDMPLRMTILLA